ncbi:hypothetical protein N9C10_03525 [Flavobacteriaceae bacterium]|nr:hypothetical protein [Flavobacteriaceae bacterium]
MFLKYLTIGLSLTNAVTGRVMLQSDVVPQTQEQDGKRSPPTHEEDAFITTTRPPSPPPPPPQPREFTTRPVEETVYVEQEYHRSPSPPPPPPPIKTDYCTEDIMECWDGSTVRRIPERGCVFSQCPVKPQEDDGVLFCDDFIIEKYKEQVKESRCIDDCDCISMYITSLASLECIISDKEMKRIEISHESYHHCTDDQTGESFIEPRQELLRNTQNTCRNGQCEIEPQTITDFEKEDEDKRDKAEQIGEVSDYDGVIITVINVEEDLKPTKEPVRDVDVILEENTNVRDLIKECLPDCDGSLDQSMCEIAERVMTKNCTIVCDSVSHDVEQDILKNCEMFSEEKESASILDAYGFNQYSSAGVVFGMGLISAIVLANV